MNPNDNTQNQNQNPNLNQMGGNTNNNQFVNPNPIGFGVQQPQATITPVQNMAPSPSNNVAPTPMPSTMQNVTPTQMPASNPSSVVPTPMTDASTLDQTKEDPNAKIADVYLPPNVNMQSEPEVINTVKSKGSNILLFIVIIILVFFAINIDKVAEMYENYMKTGSLTEIQGTTNNTTDAGYIKIDDSTSSMKLNDVNFYNFRKDASNNSISLNYESYQNVDDSKSLNIYIELYNSEKELLYKELFNTNSSIGANTSSNYTISTDSDIINDSFYALVRIYSGSEISSTSTLTCTLADNNYNYENTYNFTNNSLMSYDVTKSSLSVDDSNLQNEYNEIASTVGATYVNGVLKYSVDLNNTNIEPIYNLGVTPTVVKNRSSLEGWNCK